MSRDDVGGYGGPNDAGAGLGTWLMSQQPGDAHEELVEASGTTLLEVLLAPLAAPEGGGGR